MKAKNWLLITGLALSGLVWNGCYTQLARPDREEDTQVAEESEATVEETERASGERDYYDDRDADRRHDTHVYVYGGGWYRPYWYSPYSSWYRYPRSRFYVSFGFGYYNAFDPWGWCGSPWSWCDPWDYYSPGYWNPYYSGGRYYDPFYSPHYVYRDRNVEQKKRTITRRGSSPQDGDSPGTYAGGSGRGSLSRPSAGTFARGDDGSYRRVRRTGATDTGVGRTPKAVSDSQSGSRDDSGRRAVKRSSSGSDDGTYRRPANRGSSDGNSRGSVRRGKNEPSSGDSGSRRGSNKGSSGSGGSVSPPSGSGSSGQSAPPPSSSGSSNNGSSSNRRTRNNN